MSFIASLPVWVEWIEVPEWKITKPDTDVSTRLGRVD